MEKYVFGMKKYVFGLIMFFALITQFSVISQAASTDHFESGSGTEADPYVIVSASQLAYLAEVVNAGDENYFDKHYILGADIDLSDYGRDWNDGKGWIPIAKDHAD
ncbi:MAG: hypothetical protein LBV33_07760, partial [Lachnospiraceae bacterium]|nr:hypothetical protein [Lachnospiraceae bacterium]